MSSMKVFNRIQEFFPEGQLLDTSGNCFNLFMEFPTTDGRMAGVVIWEEGVNMYSKGGQVLTKDDYYAVNAVDDDELLEEYRQHEVILFSNDDYVYDDDDNAVLTPQPSDIFDTNTMIAIGRTWSKFNICFRKALRGE